MYRLMASRQALLLMLVAALCGSLVLLEGVQRPVRRDLLIAAAASLSAIAPQLTRAFHDATGIDTRFNFAGSNTLARQIIEGARVDAFVSADAAQMDAVERAGRVVENTRMDVISNQLAVVVNRRRGGEFRPEDLASAAVRRVGMGDTASVPAGVYGRQWLEMARLWPAVQSKVVPLGSSPAVVAAVRAGRADAGVVYASDARSVTDVSVAYLVPPEDAPSIAYPAAVIVGGRVPLALRFVEFLRGAAAQKIFEAAGFRPLAAR